jgi:beta-glucosidase
MARQSNGAMELTFNAKSFTGSDTVVQIGQCDASATCDNTLDITISGDWNEYRISLSCFEKLGVDMTNITSALVIKARKGVDIGLGNVRLESDLDAKPGCDGN